MLTPKDLENPKRPSGYDHVTNRAGRVRPKPYQAEGGGRRLVHGVRVGGPAWRGFYRATALEAAQDYCDYINGNPSIPAAPKLKSPGHTFERPKRVMDAEERAAWGVIKDRQAQRAGVQGYVYCIGQVEQGGRITAVKIGYSVNPKKRVPELQTGNPTPLKLLCMRKGSEATEKRLHKKYISRNILQEWFAPTKDMLLEFDLDPEGNPYPKEGRA